jgi:uncharacterized protein YndB with AHSA1/START domain
MDNKVDKEVSVLTQTRTQTFERTVPAAPKEVYRALTTNSALRDWLCNTADVDPRTGGRIYLWWDTGYYTAGVFTSVTRDASLAFTWRGPNDPEAAEVSIELSPQGEATGVTVTHSPSDSAHEGTESADKIKAIWESGLENLESILQSGVDLRFVRRPMFGLSGADMLTDELAAQLGVPVKEGMHLIALVEGMGAHNAGLQKHDVVVSLAGHDITNFQALTVALQSHQAGDKVPVVYYRGPDKHTVTMELVKRPAADIPETPEGVATVARTLYEQVDAEMDKVFEGATEAEAGYRPGPDEWNAREIVCHLMALERDTQMWITTLVEDVDILQAFHTNENVRIKSLAGAYPTIPALLAELKRNEALTIAMIEALPPEAVARKHLFRQISQWLTSFDIHTRQHIAEIANLLQAARS